MCPSTLPTVLAEIRAEDPDGIGGNSFDAPLSVNDQLWGTAVNRCLGR